MTSEQQSIIELAECIKELCRILSPSDFPEQSKDVLEARFGAMYKKASKAKDRVNAV